MLQTCEIPNPGRPRWDDVDDTAAEPTVRGWKRMLLLCMAGASLTIGLVGVFLPVLPTTPFVLLSSCLLVRSSPRLHAALNRSRIFGPIITDWQVRGGVRRGLKLKAAAVVVLTVAATTYFADFSATQALTVTLLAAIGIVVIIRLPEARPEAR